MMTASATNARIGSGRPIRLSAAAVPLSEVLAQLSDKTPTKRDGNDPVHFGTLVFLRQPTSGGPNDRHIVDPKDIVVAAARRGARQRFDGLQADGLPPRWDTINSLFGSWERFLRAARTTGRALTPCVGFRTHPPITLNVTGAETSS